MKKLLFSALAILVSAFAASAQDGPVICAHRGFWTCKDVPNCENSVTSLRMAQEYGIWGSEFDVHMTSDGIVVVHHDDVKDGLRIHESTYEELSSKPLSNGEILPTVDDYLAQGEKSSCMLVMELKPQGSAERGARMTDICFEALKAHGLWDPSRVMFISFDLDICKKVAAEAPEFTNQYLSGNLSPAKLHEMGINGLDYHFAVFHLHPKWVEKAHELGMSVNVWTVDSRREMEYLESLGVDCITTNEPLLK